MQDQPEVPEQQEPPGKEVPQAALERRDKQDLLARQEPLGQPDK